MSEKSKRYEEKEISEKDKLKNIVDAYVPRSEELLSGPNTLKMPRNISDTKVPLVRIYTDGSAKIDKDNKQKSCLTGWGYVKREYDRDRKHLITTETAHGGSLRGVVNLAELEAIDSAVSSIDRNCMVAVVTDSLRSIEFLTKDKESVIGKIKELESKEKLTPGENWSLRINRKSLSIKEKIESSNLIKGFEVGWIKAHCLDEYSESEIPRMGKIGEDKSISPQDKLLIEDMLGNDLADEQADKGAYDALHSQIKKIRRISKDLDKGSGARHSPKSAGWKSAREMERSINNIENQTHVRFIKNSLIDIIGKKGEGYLSDNIMNRILTKDQQAEAQDIRTERREEDIQKEGPKNNNQYNAATAEKIKEKGLYGESNNKQNHAFSASKEKPKNRKYLRNDEISVK